MKLTETEKKELIESLHVYENHDYPVLRTFYKPDMEFYDTIDEIHLVEVLQQIHQNQKLRELVEKEITWSNKNTLLTEDKTEKDFFNFLSEALMSLLEDSKK